MPVARFRLSGRSITLLIVTAVLALLGTLLVRLVIEARTAAQRSSDL